MRCQIESTTLSRVLRLVVPLAKRPGAGVLPGPTLMKLSVFGDRLTVSTADTEVSAMVSAPVQDAEDGLLAVPAVPVDTMVRSISGVVTLTSTGSRLKLQAGRATAQWAAAGLDLLLDHWVNPDPTTTLTLPIRTLTDAIDRTLYTVAAEDDSRPWLTGLLWEAEGTRLKITGTNAKRMAHAAVRLGTPASAPTKTLLPGPGLHHLRRMFRDLVGDCHLLLSEAHAEIAVDTLRLRMRVLAEASAYPKYQTLLDRLDPAVTATANRSTLLAAVERAKTVDIQAVLAVEDQALRLTTRSSEAESDETVEADVVLKGDDRPAIRVGVAFLEQALGAVQDDDVVLRWNPTFLRIEDPSYLDTVHVMAPRSE